MTKLEIRGFYLLLGFLIALLLLKPAPRKEEVVSKDIQESADDLGVRLKKSGERAMKADRDRETLKIAAEHARREEAS